MNQHATIDFETYSAAGFRTDVEGKIRGTGPQGRGGLSVVGTPNYVAHPTAEVLCLAYRLPGRDVQLWVPGAPDPLDLLRYVQAYGVVEAFNVTFELYVWNEVCASRYNWPDLLLEQCTCAMAAARSYSLPGSLANVSKALNTPGKDQDGTRLIQKLTRPHTPTKKRSADRWTTATAWEDFQALYEYCRQDVTAEVAISTRIPALTDTEREVWLVDQRINARGVQVDVETLDAALSILAQAETKYNTELSELTGGKVTAATELARLQEWLDGQKVYMYNMQKSTIDEVVGLLDPTTPAYRALRIRQILGSANIKKLHTLRLQVSADGRLREQYMYCGADRTGRWSAKGVQLQNMTAKGPDVYVCESCSRTSGMESCLFCGAWLTVRRSDWNTDAIHAAIQDIRTGGLAVVERCWGDNPIAVLCGCLRGLFIAAPGHDLICVDYSAIEAVVAACLSRCQWRIDVFNSDRDIYLESIQRIAGTEDRKRGKIAELASGYGGWIKSWQAFGASEYMDEDEIKTAILAWRAASPEIVQAWGGQYAWNGPGKWDYRPELFGFEGMAIQAILDPGTPYSHIDITYLVENDILYCRLPSGRLLHYHTPRLSVVRDRLNRGDAYQITFMGYNSNAAKGPPGWQRMETYGGRLFENVCQAVARDLQAAAMVACEEAGYPVVMHTHDEICAEVLVSHGSVEDMVKIMTRRPAWAAWWPVQADGWRAGRYQK